MDRSSETALQPAVSAVEESSRKSARRAVDRRRQRERRTPLGSSIPRPVRNMPLPPPTIGQQLDAVADAALQSTQLERPQEEESDAGQDGIEPRSRASVPERAAWWLIRKYDEYAS